MRVPMPLPWKRPQKGLAVAEAGATFRVELGEDGWECSVTQGRKKQVLAKGLQRQRDGLCRAEAHAASMPEVRAALAEGDLEEAEPAPKAARKDRRKGRRKSAAKRASEKRSKAAAASKRSSDAAASVRVAKSAVDFKPVEDGCICGQVGDATWVADPRGRVEFAGDVTDEDKKKVHRAAQKHFETESPVDVQKPQAKTSGKDATPARPSKKDRLAPAKPAEPPANRPPARGLRWTEVADGERASTSAGAFAIVAEGDRQSLYFYDLNGQSRFLTDRGDLKKAAEEFAARGEVGPSTRRPSRELSARMQDEFLRQAAEEVRS